MKRCRKCHEVKADEEFPLILSMRPLLRAAGVRYRSSPCRDCRNTHVREWYRVHLHAPKPARPYVRRAPSKTRPRVPRRCACGMSAYRKTEEFWFCRACFKAQQV